MNLSFRVLPCFNNLLNFFRVFCSQLCKFFTFCAQFRLRNSLSLYGRHWGRKMSVINWNYIRVKFAALKRNPWLFLHIINKLLTLTVVNTNVLCVLNSLPMKQWFRIIICGFLFCYFIEIVLPLTIFLICCIWVSLLSYRSHSLYYLECSFSVYFLKILFQKAAWTGCW